MSKKWSKSLDFSQKNVSYKLFIYKKLAMKKEIKERKLIHFNEKFLSILVILISATFWACLIVFTLWLGLIYLIWVFLISFFIHAKAIYFIKGNWIKVSEKQFPKLFQIKTELEVKMLIDEKVDMYIIEKENIFQTISQVFLSRNFIIIPAKLIDYAWNNIENLKFTIANQLAHIKRWHIQTRFFISPALFVPFLWNAYLKACEYTADNFATYYGYNQDYKKAIQDMALAYTWWKKINPDEYIKQASEVQWLLWAFYEAKSSKPYLSKRAYNIAKRFSEEKVKIKLRNPIWAVLAPVLSFSMFVIVFASWIAYIGYQKIENKIAKYMPKKEKITKVNLEKYINNEKNPIDQFFDYYKKYNNKQKWDFGIVIKEWEQTHQAKIINKKNNKIYVTYYDAVNGKDVYKRLEINDKRIVNFYIYSPYGYFDKTKWFWKLVSLAN